MGYYTTEEEAAHKYDETVATLGRPLNFPTNIGDPQAVKGMQAGKDLNHEGVTWNPGKGKWGIKGITATGKRAKNRYFDSKEDAKLKYEETLLSKSRPAPPAKKKARCSSTYPLLKKATSGSQNQHVSEGTSVITAAETNPEVDGRSSVNQLAHLQHFLKPSPMMMNFNNGAPFNGIPFNPAFMMPMMMGSPFYLQNAGGIQYALPVSNINPLSTSAQGLGATDTSLVVDASKNPLEPSNDGIQGSSVREPLQNEHSEDSKRIQDSSERKKENDHAI